MPQVMDKKRKFEEDSHIKKSKKKKNKFKKIQENEVTSTTSPVEFVQNNKSLKKNKIMQNTTLDMLWKRYKKRSTPIVKINGDWCLELMKEVDKPDSTSADIKKNLKDLAYQVIQDDIEAIKKIGVKNKESQFQKNLMSKGTARDKMAAHMLKLMEDPIHSLSSLETIVNMITPKAKGYFIELMNSLKELLSTTLLTAGYVAKQFEKHNFSLLLPLIVTAPEQALKQIVLWYFSDQLFMYYQKLVKQLSYIAKDSVESNKKAAIRTLLDLLCDHPEQETELVLSILVNKLGDPSRKVTSQTTYGLRIVLQKRPSLKTRVVCLVEELLFRSNIGEKARFYSLCFLKDMIFSQGDYKLAEKLVKLYFGFFKACTKKGEVDTRMMGALLRGLNRAYPYLSSEGSKVLDEQINTLYKLVHLVNFAIATQALQLLYQVLGSQEDQASDRFYQAIYRKIQDPSFGSSSACSAFLNLLFKAMCKDDSNKRIRAFIKRLIQTCQYLDSNMICAILYLISEILKEKPSLQHSEVIFAPNFQNVDNDDSDTEYYPDFDIDDSGNITSLNAKHTSEENQDEDQKKLFSETKSSWVHQQNQRSTDAYDPFHRNPLYCGAENTIFWELQKVLGHFHPSVKLFASKLLNGKPLDYTGDPILDFTLIKFLDRFVYKNPKKQAEKKDNAGGDVLGRKSQYISKGARSIVVNSEEFKNLKEEKVPEDEIFFYRYFTQHQKTVLKKEESDDESVDDDEFDDYLNKMSGVTADDEDDIDFASSATANNTELDVDDDGMLSDNSDEEINKVNLGDDLMEQEDELDDSRWDDLDGDDDDNSDASFGEISDEEDIEFSDSEDEVNKTKSKAKTGLQNKTKNKQKKRKLKNEPTFADSDDFAHLLEENAEDGNLAITSEAFCNKDSSSVKQIKWESKRNQYMKGNTWKNRRNNEKFGKKFNRKSKFKK